MFIFVKNNFINIRKDMGENENKPREEIFSKSVRAGKRTYFFDVKATKAGEQYITITESKKRFDQEHGKFFYEKHKLFLYKEDFEKFSNGLTQVVSFVETGVRPPEDEPETPHDSSSPAQPANNDFSNVNFEDLGSEGKKE